MVLRPNGVTMLMTCPDAPTPVASVVRALSLYKRASAINREKTARTNFRYLTPLPIARLILPNNGTGFRIDMVDGYAVHKDRGCSDVFGCIIAVPQRKAGSDLS